LRGGNPPSLFELSPCRSLVFQLSIITSHVFKDFFFLVFFFWIFLHGGMCLTRLFAPRDSISFLEIHEFPSVFAFVGISRDGDFSHPPLSCSLVYCCGRHQKVSVPSTWRSSSWNFPPSCCAGISSLLFLYAVSSRVAESKGTLLGFIF